MDGKLSIIIPVFNEISTLESLISKVEAVALTLEKEIILIDDASTDGTTQLIENNFNKSHFIFAPLLSFELMTSLGRNKKAKRVAEQRKTLFLLQSP